ncbi:MAG: hypothetical protein D3913_01285 [Candidatus Electrothrix sp. LOE1_4_5]|nr:hypothetical protein [Candidatus Electrothrix gigas]
MVYRPSVKNALQKLDSRVHIIHFNGDRFLGPHGLHILRAETAALAAVVGRGWEIYRCVS